MWEITLKCDKIHYKSIEFIEENLFNQFGKDVVLGKICSDVCFLSIATQNNIKEDVWEVLKKLLCVVFCQHFKKEFLKDHLTFLEPTNVYFDAFLKIFTYFDLELEQAITYRLINYQPCIILESYFLFKLGAIKNKWQDLCDITNKNDTILLENETFLDLLKFLINSIETKTDCVVLSFEDRCLLYEDKKNSNKVWIALTENPVETVCKLIDLSPKKIVVHSNHNFRTTEKIISFLFEGKIKY